MDKMDAMGLHEIRKAAGTTDTRHRRNLLMPHFALLDQFKIKREHRKITAAGAPRRVIGGDVLLGQWFSFCVRQRRNGSNNVRRWDIGGTGTHF